MYNVCFEVKKVDVNIEDEKEGNNLLMEALTSLNSSVTVIEYLIKNGANVNHRNLFGSTPLHFAGRNRHAESARLLINHGARLNVRDNRGQTPVHAVCTPRINNTTLTSDVLRLYLEADNEVINVRDFEGRTALRLLCQEYFHPKNVDELFNLVDYLLEKGADVNVKDNEGQGLLKGQSFKYLSMERKTKLISILTKHGAESLVQYYQEFTL